MLLRPTSICFLFRIIERIMKNVQILSAGVSVDLKTVRKKLYCSTMVTFDGYMELVILFSKTFPNQSFIYPAVFT